MSGVINNDLCGDIPLAADGRCPVCGGTNECRIAKGCLYKDACWCEANKIPSHVLDYIANLQLERACLCRRCLEAVARQAAGCDQPEKILELVRAEVNGMADDFYFDAEERLVFTASYHLKRGFCCGSGCRNCPFPKSSCIASA